MTMIDVGACEALWVEQMTAPGLSLPIGGDEEAWLCLPDTNGPVAISLAGEWIFHSDAIAQLSNRRGLFVPNVLIRADLDSRVEDSNSKFGTIVRSEGVYGIRTRRVAQGSGFTQTLIVQIDGGEPHFVQDAVRIAFPKWEIGQQVGESWVQLWSVDVSGT